MSGDTFDFLQGNRETLTGTLHDPAATPGDVLTVQPDGSVAAVPGGGSMPDIAWRGPFDCDVADYVLDFPPGSGNGGIPIDYSLPDGGVFLRAIILPTVKFVHPIQGVLSGSVSIWDADEIGDTHEWNDLRSWILSPDPADWAGNFAPAIFSDQMGLVDGLGLEPPVSDAPGVIGYAVKIAGTMQFGLCGMPSDEPPSQGHAKVWLETFEPPA